MGFNKNVFVNCPFDGDYLSLLRPLLFTIIYLNFTPRIALEELDSGAPRIQKIISLIEESRYGIHDLSRLQAVEAGEYFRLNMPLELGLDIGCKRFKGGKWAKKKCLILGAERYRYQAAISDLSNSDIAVHENEAARIVAEVRNWLNNEAQLVAPGPSAVWGRYTDFIADNYKALRANGHSDNDIENLPVGELIRCMRDWVKENS